MFFYQFCSIDSSLVKMAPPAESHVLYCHIVSRKFEVLGTRVYIEVSKLSIYREEDINYITPKMIIFSVFFIIIKLLFFVYKTNVSERNSFSHQKHIFSLTVIKIVHI